MEEIQEDLTANNIGQILWGHWLEIGDIGRHWGNWAEIADSKYIRLMIQIVDYSI